MARNGSGTFALLANLATANTVSSSTTVNSTMDDVATGLTESINIDGTKAWEANQSVGGFKFTSLGDGSAVTDSANLKQVQNRTVAWADGSGTDEITATYAPAVAAVVDGMNLRVRAAGANATTTPTFSPNGLTARVIKKHNGQALVANDIAGDEHDLDLTYVATGTYWNLNNPAIPAALSAASTTEVLTGTDTAKYATANAIAALWEAGSDVSDGAAITIGEGGYFNLITSTTAITSFVVTTSKAGRTFRCRFNTVRTLTHNATSLILPGAASITTAAGDIAQFRDLGSGNVVCEWYTKADGTAVVSSSNKTLLATLTTTSGTTHSVTSISSVYRELYVEIAGVSFDGAGTLSLAVSDDNGSNYGTARPISGSSGAAGNSLYGMVRVSNLQAADSFVVAHGVASTVPTSSPSIVGAILAEAGGSPAAINAIQFSGGTFDAGTIRVYGVK